MSDVEAGWWPWQACCFRVAPARVADRVSPSRTASSSSPERLVESSRPEEDDPIRGVARASKRLGGR